MATPQEIKQEVRKRYGQAAKRTQQSSDCCGGPSANESEISSNLYQTDELQHLPREAVIASLGCGNPVAVADLHEGETVLDLGSGGGIDVLLSARRVGPTGVAYGLDMTDEMLSLAETNKAKAPVLREGFRVLKPGGRFAVSDVVVIGELPAQVRSSMEAWAGCIAGALRVDEYRALLGDAGFEDIEVEVTRRYDPADSGLDDLALPDDSTLASAFIRARKPL